MLTLAIHNTGVNSASETFRTGLDQVAMELEHHKDSVTIVEEEKEEGRGGEGGRERGMAKANKLMLMPRTQGWSLTLYSLIFVLA